MYKIKVSVSQNKIFDDTLSLKKYMNYAEVAENMQSIIKKKLSERVDDFENLQPIFYVNKKDIVAARIAALTIEENNREVYELGKYWCIFSKNMLGLNIRKHLHLCFRGNQLLATRSSIKDETNYVGVLFPWDSQVDNKFYHRNKLVESFSVDLKLGIYDVRFEDFFNMMFDFYLTLGVDW